MAGRSAAQRYYEHEVIGSCVCDLVACGTTLCNASAVALQICTSSLVRVVSMLVDLPQTYSIDDAVYRIRVRVEVLVEFRREEVQGRVGRQDSITCLCATPHESIKIHDSLAVYRPHHFIKHHLFHRFKSIVTYTHQHEVRSRFRRSRCRRPRW